MKVIIAGSRSVKDYASVRQAIMESGLWGRHKRSIEVVCGMAPGVDRLGKEFAENNSLTVHPMPADWDNLDAPGAVIRTNKYGKKYNVKAGEDRNIEMGKFADALLVIWDGVSTGTVQMHKWAESNGYEEIYKGWQGPLQIFYLERT